MYRYRVDVNAVQVDRFMTFEDRPMERNLKSEFKKWANSIKISELGSGLLCAIVYMRIMIN